MVQSMVQSAPMVTYAEIGLMVQSMVQKPQKRMVQWCSAYIDRRKLNHSFEPLIEPLIKDFIILTFINIAFMLSDLRRKAYNLIYNIVYME